MAQLLVFFATSKCSPRVIKWFKQTSQPAHVNELYDRKPALKTNVKKIKQKNLTVIPVEPLLLSPTPQKEKKLSPKENYLYIYFSGEEVMKAEEH